MKKAGVGGTGFFPHRREPEKQKSSVGETDDYTYSLIKQRFHRLVKHSLNFQITLSFKQFACQKFSNLINDDYYIVIINFRKFLNKLTFSLVRKSAKLR
jgi:hypothetical protein